MKYGFRTPSIKKSISARTSIKRQIVHKAGLKMPKGYGAIRDPKKALYNKVYNKTTIKNPLLGLASSSTKKQSITTKKMAPLQQVQEKNNPVKGFFRLVLSFIQFVVLYFIGIGLIISYQEDNAVLGSLFMVLFPVAFIIFKIQMKKAILKKSFKTVAESTNDEETAEELLN